jgi:RimJ/RimL family protein N-acetyltransferase
MERIPGFVAGDGQCVAVISRHEIVAVACYNNFYPGKDIEISFASDHPRWATKNSIREILGYPFFQLNVQRVSARAPKSNKKTRRLMKGIGFEPLFIYGLIREDYLERYGKLKEKTTGTAAST